MPPSKMQNTQVRMKGPEGSGNVCVAGFELEPDDDGCIEVPPHHVKELEAHGYRVVTLAKAEAPKKGKKGE